MKIKLNRKMNKLNAFVFNLCSCSAKNLTWLFIGIVFGEQFISAGLEYLITGDTFKHWFDSVFLIAASSAYFYFAHGLGDFLLDLNLNAEIDKEA